MSNPNLGMDTTSAMQDPFHGVHDILPHTDPNSKISMEQVEMLKEFHASLVDRFDTKLAEVKDGVTRRLVEIESTMKKHERRNRNSAAAIVKQSGEIASIKSKIERLEDALTTPKPQLTSKSG